MRARSFGHVGQAALFLACFRFLQALDTYKTDWKKSVECEDSVLGAIDNQLAVGTPKYAKSPIFVFTDALPNDDRSTQLDLLSRLSTYRSPVITILYGGEQNENCNPGERAKERARPTVCMLPFLCRAALQRLQSAARARVPHARRHHQGADRQNPGSRL